MNRVKPKQHYHGIFTDTHNWENFEHRPGDIFICVPPKSGTTWMQMICGLLIFGDPEDKTPYPEISPWIEFSLSSKLIETRLATLAAQTHQRFIKSHSPLDGVPYYDDCHYIVCHRHPLDVHFSMWHHVQNMKLDQMNHLYTDDRAANFDAFLANGIEGEGLDQPSLELLTHHLQTARALAHLPNVHLFHYASMSADLPREMQRIATAIGVSHAPDLFDRLVEKASFASMKTNARQTAPGSANGLYKDPSAFFNSGKHRKWDSILDDAQIGRYKAEIAGLLSKQDVRYIETGAELG